MLIFFVNAVRSSLVCPKRFLIFKSFPTILAIHLLLDTAVETENVSLGIRSLRKIFATYRTLRFATSLP